MINSRVYFRKVMLIPFFLILIVTGCNTLSTSPEDINNPVYESASHENVVTLPGNTADSSKEQEKNPEDSVIEAGTMEAPDKEEVLAMRQKVLEGMTEEEADRLTEGVKVSNLWYENKIMWENMLKKMSDPEQLYWNYVDYSGDIQIGWTFETEDLLKKKESTLSEEEFNETYGEPVIVNNNRDAEAFVEKMTVLKGLVSDRKLQADFDQLIHNMQMAKDTHDVSFIEEIYKILHDMDYFLLRYGPEDVGKYTHDKSTVSRYYGALNVYSHEQ